MARQDDHVRHTIRIPREIYERICALPGEGSINAKIINTLDGNSGETLRDRFAMAALTAYLSRPDADDRPYAEIADWCFDMADAMLAMRAPS